MNKFEVVITYSMRETLIVDANSEDEARERVFMGEGECVESEPLSAYRVEEIIPLSV